MRELVLIFLVNYFCLKSFQAKQVCFFILLNL